MSEQREPQSGQTDPKEQLRKRILNDFVYHAPFGDQAERYKKIRDFGQEYALFLVAHCPASRELSVALTHLEETVMWANAAIARNETMPPTCPTDDPTDE